MKYLITGINGFVGSYLSEYLLKKEKKIYGTVYPKNSTGNIKHIIKSIKTFPCNITKSAEIEQILKKIKPERIYHLAAQGFVPESWSNPLNTFKINILGTLYLLNTVKKYLTGARVLIVCSSDEYGAVSDTKAITEDVPLNPQNPYAISKLYVDLLSGQYAEFSNLKIIRVRPFPHIGPRQSPSFVVSDFSRQIALIEKKKQPPVIKVGNLNSKRDFTDVRDMVRAYELAIEKGKSGDVYNISSGKIYSIEEILNRLLSMSETKIKIEKDPSKLRVKDNTFKIGDSSKFRSLTKWSPEIPIKTTLEETLDYWRKEV